MREHSKIATISVAVFVGLLAVYFGGYQNGKSSNPSIDTEQAELVPQRAPVTAKTIDSRDDNSPRILGGDELRKADQAALERLDSYSNDEKLSARLAEFESRYVRPYNPAKKVCHQEWKEDQQGSQSLVEVCRDVYQFPRHEYFSFSDDVLEQLAYAEPLAAVIMAERTASSDPIKSLGYSVHASALSGKPGPLLGAAWGAFNWSSKDSSTRVTTDTLYTHLALIKVAGAMGDLDAQMYERPKRLADLPINEAAVDQRVVELKKALVRTQMTVTGSSSLKEVFGV